jgi:hypothetical protein
MTSDTKGPDRRLASYRPLPPQRQNHGHITYEPRLYSDFMRPRGRGRCSMLEADRRRSLPGPAIFSPPPELLDAFRTATVWPADSSACEMGSRRSFSVSSILSESASISSTVTVGPFGSGGGSLSSSNLSRIDSDRSETSSVVLTSLAHFESAEPPGLDPIQTPSLSDVSGL